MCDLNKTILRDSTEDESDDNSDDKLKIVEFPSPKRKTSSIKPSETEKLIIESIEDELERRLEEKAAKTKLNSKHVKNIIRHVVTNEHVLAMVRKAENPKECDESIPYEPKLTRAKAKELLSNSHIPAVPWATPRSTSEVQVLFSEDLQEDSSGDEYIPCEEESEDDREGSILSDPPSIPPATPSTPTPNTDSLANWTEDGIFKIPPTKPTEPIEGEANIARRTRSKLCLSSTPLEVIEEAFIPPDITTDMYDMDCDNDDWMDFLKKFTRPLDEIAKATEDEEQDPEYNILADEEIDKVDKEELRVDKAVKVTRKELNDLIAELFECSEVNTLNEENKPVEIEKNTKSVNTGQRNVNIEQIEDVVKHEISNNTKDDSESVTIVNGCSITDEERSKDIYIKRSQIPLLEQQMRQHVQFLAQNFILTYNHPEFHHYSDQMREYLLNLKFLCEGKQRSMFYTVNLFPALKLVEDWINLCESNSDEVKEMISHINKTTALSIHRKQTNVPYVLTFPKLILETISNSEVFLYPTLLAKIPFKPSRLFSKYMRYYTDSEDHLIALGLEQFVPLLNKDKKNLSRSGDVRLTILSRYIQEYMMPHKDAYKIQHHLQSHKTPRCANNPIKYYYQYKKAPPVVHYVVPLEELKILPPKKRPPEELPLQWQMFNYPVLDKSKVTAKCGNIVPQALDTALNAETSQVPKTYPSSIPTITVTSGKLVPQTIDTTIKTGTNFAPNTSTVYTPSIPTLTVNCGNTSLPQAEALNATINTIPSFAPDTSTVYPPSIPTVTINCSNISLPQAFNATINTDPALLPKTPITCPPPISINPLRPKAKRRTGSKINKSRQKIDPISKFVECLSRPSPIQRLLNLYKFDISDKKVEGKENTSPTNNSSMLPSMPNLATPVKKCSKNDASSSTEPNASKKEDKDVPSTSSVSTVIKGDSKKGSFHDFSTISSTSFQQPDTSAEIEFCNPADSVQTITTTANSPKLLAPTCKQDTVPGISDITNEVQGARSRDLEKDNPDDINALMVASSTVKPSVRKEPSGAEKKRAKLRREFLANLSVSTPEDPQVEKQKNEMFALAYYDKIRESLELEDYHKIMQILNDHEEGDAVDLYKKIKEVLSPKYQDLADEFLLFLREKEAKAVGQLIPWIQMNNRSKFLRKLEIYFKDQPAQLRKIYKCLTELSQNVGVSMEKIKNTLLPMFKGNAVLTDLFLQNFMEERPPPSLLEGPYETIDISKEMSRADDEEIYETIAIPDVEDKYGGPSCICNCHQIEDPEFKSRYRHCIRCGTRFINGKVYIQTGRGLRPATVSFLTSPNTDHNIRLLGKTPTVTNRRKKRSETSPSKQVTLSPTKENPDEESEDEVDGKKKTKKKSSKRKTQSGKTPKEAKGSQKNTVAKRNVTSKCDSAKFHGGNAVQKGFKSNSRKRSYSVRKSKGKDSKKSDSSEVEEQPATKLDAIPTQEKGSAEECMEWEDNPVVGESSTAIKPNSPGHQTAESESEFCEESSQDNCESDSNSSVSSSNNHSQSDSNIGEESSWKREEDKIILETFQKENDKEHAFKIISSQLKNRTVPQISNRFQTLMTLLLETLGTS